MSDVVMPRLSDSMEEGTILKWLVADGTEVTRGQEIAEIETDKATMPYEADADGVLAIVAAEGETLPIGTVIARIGGDGAPPSGNGAATVAPTTTQTEGTVPPVPQPPPTAVPSAPAPATPIAAGARVKASPVARRIAREQGIDLAALSGTGPGGRIVRADVERAGAGGAASAPPVAPATTWTEGTVPAVQAAPPPPVVSGEPGTAKGTVTVQELSRTQQLVARRMAESRATVPDFTITSEIDMQGCVELRGQLKALAAEDEAPPSYNDMVVKACALALREYPRANGAYKDAKFELYGRVNVGVAVAAEDSLVVPTVFDADSKSLAQIAREARALAARVRAGAITPPELSGGTFTVSNLGMFGVARFTAVINPPQAAILAVGSMTERAVVRDGQLVARHMMDVTLACDHRILYGADAAQFLARIRALLEQPLALML